MTTCSIEDYSKRIQFDSHEVPSLLTKHIGDTMWSTFLDVGCGDGRVLLALNRAGLLDGKTVYAIDISERRIGFVKSRLPQFNYFVDDACSMRNIQDSTIDVLISTQVIEHVPSDEDMVRELNRVLRDGGLAYISTVLRNKHAWWRARCNGRWTLDPTHVREYTHENQLFDLLTKHGFRVLEDCKSRISYSISDGFFRSINARRDVYDNRFLSRIRVAKIPAPGYREWEIVCKKERGLGRIVSSS